jgi:dihydropteroate synthase
MILRPALMAIVNCTPDSFSGDGRSGEAAWAHLLSQCDAGADLIDVGAESTRPGAVALASEEEWQRLAPILQRAGRADWRRRITLSVDTRHAETARRALAEGVDIVNDVTGLRDAAMREVLAASRCDVVVMHALSVPVDPTEVLPPEVDVVRHVLEWAGVMRDRARCEGIHPDRLILDPGLGFGKTGPQSLRLILEARRLVADGGRWLYGHSRKSFLGLFTAASAGPMVTSPPPADKALAPGAAAVRPSGGPSPRDDLTLAFSAMLAHQGVAYLRVHEVRRHVELFERLSPRRAAAAEDPLGPRG